jgi:hypothetical protein
VSQTGLNRKTHGLDHEKYDIKENGRKPHGQSFFFKKKKLMLNDEIK